MRLFLALLSVLILAVSLVAAALIQTHSYSLPPCIAGIRESNCGGPYTDYRIPLRLSVGAAGAALSGLILLVGKLSLRGHTD